MAKPAATAKDRFAKPDVQSAILNWLLEGYQMLQDEGLKPPKAMLESTASYARDSIRGFRKGENGLPEEAKIVRYIYRLFMKGIDTLRHWALQEGWKKKILSRLQVKKNGMATPSPVF